MVSQIHCWSVSKCMCVFYSISSGRVCKLNAVLIKHADILACQPRLCVYKRSAHKLRRKITWTQRVPLKAPDIYGKECMHESAVPVLWMSSLPSQQNVNIPATAAKEWVLLSLRAKIGCYLYQTTSKSLISNCSRCFTCRDAEGSACKGNCIWIADSHVTSLRNGNGGKHPNGNITVFDFLTVKGARSRQVILGQIPLLLIWTVHFAQELQMRRTFDSLPLSKDRPSV